MKLRERASVAGMVIIVALNAVVLAWLAAEAFYSLHADPIVIRTASDVSRAFEEYQFRAEALQKLVAALVGLSSVYALALGFSTYLNAKQYVDTLKEDVQKVRKQAFKLRLLKKQFPTFSRMEDSAGKMVKRIKEMLPDTEAISAYYKSMTPQGHEEVLLYEKSVSFFELLDLPGNSNYLEVYLRLSKYYRAKYSSDSPGRTEAPNALDRAEFYLNRYARMGDDFIACNERAIIAYTRDRLTDATVFFGRSIEIQPKQQRARFWLSLIQHRAGEYSKAEKTLTEALDAGKAPVWERESSTERVNDIYYNRACARSRLAELAMNELEKSRYLELGMCDLKSASTRPDSATLDQLDDDAAGDLSYVKTHDPAGFEEIRRRLSPGT